jgi:hypothetical protein
LVDLWVCLVFYGALEFLDRRLRGDRIAPEGKKG